MTPPAGKWIEFVDCTALTKTKRYMILNKEKNILLGEIKWYGAFRKYSFFPEIDTVYETQCLQDIISFINYLMEERKHFKIKP